MCVHSARRWYRERCESCSERGTPRRARTTSAFPPTRNAMARPPRALGFTALAPLATLATAPVRAASPAPAPSPVAPAPGWTSERWTTKDGLPVDAVTDILPARNGFLWLATFDGLVR